MQGPGSSMPCAIHHPGQPASQPACRPGGHPPARLQPPRHPPWWRDLSPAPRPASGPCPARPQSRRAWPAAPCAASGGQGTGGTGTGGPGGLGGSGGSATPGLACDAPPATQLWLGSTHSPPPHLRRASRWPPTSAQLSCRRSRSSTRSTARPAAMDTGLPPAQDGGGGERGGVTLERSGGRAGGVWDGREASKRPAFKLTCSRSAPHPPPPGRTKGVEVQALRHDGGNLGRGHHRGQGQPVADAFGHGHNVRDDALHRKNVREEEHSTARVSKRCRTARQHTACASLNPPAPSPHPQVPA